MASIVAILVFISGKTNFPDFVAWVSQAPARTEGTIASASPSAPAPLPGSLAADIQTEAKAAIVQCGVDTGTVEQAICADDALKDKDWQLAVLYTEAKHQLDMEDRRRLQQAQRDWLAARTACADQGDGMTACIGTRFDERIAALKTLLRR